MTIPEMSGDNGSVNIEVNQFRRKIWQRYRWFRY